MDLEQARFNMIEQQIRPWDVADADVLHLLSVIRREDFVPLAHRSLAFVDMEIPLGWGQCMLAPRVEARMLQDAAVQKHHKVLEIGSGSGFMAALLAHRAHSLLSLEVVPELAQLATAQLRRAGIHNVEVRLANGAGGAPEDGPFDLIMVSGSLAEVPPALLAQLKIRGRLIAIVGDEPMMRATLIERTSEANYLTRQPWDTVAPRMAHFVEPSHFHF
jgi:protein-L-isoaspartate(D-aspartate) O-methyltransferase